MWPLRMVFLKKLATATWCRLSLYDEGLYNQLQAAHVLKTVNSSIRKYVWITLFYIFLKYIKKAANGVDVDVCPMNHCLVMCAYVNKLP